MRILVVEDEGIIARDIQYSLQMLGYDVPEPVSQGAAAVAAAKRLKPDLVLMDIHLAGAMDGTEAAQFIIESTDAVIVFLTAFADEETLRRAQQAMPYGYLVKPFDDETLKTTVATALHNRTANQREKQRLRLHEEEHVALQEAARQMEEKEQRQQHMVMSAAHELRQPLTPLSLHIGALRRLLADRQDVVKSLDLIERNLDRVALMLRDLLDAAKSQAGRLEVDPQPVDVVPEVTRVVETMRELAHQRKVPLEWHAVELPHVHADPMRLEQCISNLVHNAIKFTKEGTEVRVEAEVDGRSIILRVEDHGPGLDEQQAKQVFEPFHQVHQAPSGFTGTGLGLYVTKSLMQAMGGDVEVETQPGQGARFALRLMVAAAPQLSVEATRR